MLERKMSGTKRSASALAAVVLARVVEPLIRSEFYQHGLIYANDDALGGIGRQHFRGVSFAGRIHVHHSIAWT